MAFEHGRKKRTFTRSRQEHRKKPPERDAWTIATAEEFLKKPSVPSQIMARDSAYHSLVRGITSGAFSPDERVKALEILGQGIQANDIRDGVKYAMDKSPSFFADLRRKFEACS